MLLLPYSKGSSRVKNVLLPFFCLKVPDEDLMVCAKAFGVQEVATFLQLKGREMPTNISYVLSALVVCLKSTLKTIYEGKIGCSWAWRQRCRENMTLFGVWSCCSRALQLR